MTEIEFAALLVSRVCHDLVGPLGAVVNGMEVLEDERDPEMRADAIKLVTMSADQALARIQFMRIAFGAAGSAGAELDLGEIGRLIEGLLQGGKVQLTWNVPRAYWAKDWAKLLMNATLLAADCLPRGGVVTVENGAVFCPLSSSLVAHRLCCPHRSSLLLRWQNPIAVMLIQLISIWRI